MLQTTHTQRPTGGGTGRWSAWMAGAALLAALVTLLPYIQTAGFDFTNLDDHVYLTLNRRMADGLTWRNIGWALSSVSLGAIWMPLTWISYMTDVTLWGHSSQTFHWVNAVLHAANAGLVVVLLMGLLRKRVGVALPARAGHYKQPSGPVGISSVKTCAIGSNQSTGPSGRSAVGASAPSPNGNTCIRTSGQQSAARAASIALFGALLWSLHPLRVEPVAWVASRKDVLSLFWELLALIFWVASLGARAEADENAAPDATNPAGGGYGYGLLSLVCFALACMAKPMAMTFPLLAGLLELLITNRVRLARLIPSGVIAVLVVVMSVYSEHAGGAMVELTTVPLAMRVANAVASIGIYTFKTLAPTGLAVPYLHTWPQWPHFMIPGIIICAGLGWLLVGSAAAIWGNRLGWVAGLREVRWVARVLGAGAARGVFTGLAWAAFSVAPVLGLVHFGYHSHADRFTYLPLLGFSLMMVCCLAAWTPSSRAVKCLAPWCGAVWLAVLLALSWRQAGFWRDDGTIFRHTLAVTGSNHIAHRNLGIYIYSRYQDREAAIRHTAVALATSRAPNFGQRGFYVLLLAESGRLEEARVEAGVLSRLAEKLKKKEASTFIAYSAIAYFEGDRDLARQHAESVVARVPEHPDAHYLLGLIARDEGRLEAAAAYWKRSLAADFQYAFVRPWVEAIERGESDREKGTQN